MKKLLTTTAIALSLSCAAQDTTYYQQRNHFYRMVRTQMDDSTVMVKFVPQLTKKQKRGNTIFTIVVGSIFAGLTTWFWVK